MNDFTPFMEGVARQGITLHDDIVVAAERHIRAEHTWPPTATWRVISCAATMLRNEPGVRLANGLLDTGGLPPDLPAQTLGNMVNGSIQPSSESAVEAPHFRSVNEEVDNCQLAEVHFAGAYQSLRQFNLAGPLGRLAGRFTLPQFVRIGLDEEYGPVFVQKSAGVPSALTLQQVVIGGISFPAGSIVQISPRNQQHRGKPRGGVELLRADDMGMSFMRLSLFALEPEVRPINNYYHKRPGVRELRISVLGEAACEAADKLGYQPSGSCAIGAALVQ